ncbi:MAG TPA: B-box zinc finger protein, partial [Acidobacteriaceae bacterium]
MNCANHPERERAAFCQNCGKPLCEECKRVDGPSIFCEQCFAARNAAPPPGGYSSGPYAPPAAGYVPGAPRPARHAEPVLAALLGLIPGVGAMYNEQFVKGIVHLIVFAILVSLASDVNGVFGILIAGWVLYMVFEAYHTARARRDGTPLPNPFGLNDLGERMGFGKTWPGTPGAHTPYSGSSVPPYDPAAAQNPIPPAETYVEPPASHWDAPYDIPPVAPGTPMSAYPDAPIPHHRNIPTGAVWLIAIGLFFLLGHAPVFRVFHGRLFGPFLLIGVGIWVFVRSMMETGHSIENDGSDLYRWRLGHAVNRSVWMVLVGILWLLKAIGIF